MSSDSEDLLQTLYRDYRTPSVSTLHGNLPTDSNPNYCAHVMRPTRPAQNREGPNAPRPLSITSIRDKNGILRRERVKWGDSTFNLAYVPAQADKQEDKKTVLDDTVRQLRNHTTRWSVKADYLDARFSMPMANAAAIQHLAALMDYTSLSWSYTVSRALNNQFGVVQIAGLANGFPTANFVNNATYLELTMTCTPSQAWPTPPRMPGPKTRKVLLRLPLDINGTLMPTVTLDMIVLPMQLLEHIQALDMQSEFGIKTDDDLDPTKFERWNQENYEHARFESIAHILSTLYVGEGVIMSTPNRLRSLQQRTHLADGRSYSFSITDHFNKFQSVVAELDPSLPYNMSLVEIFFSSLTPTIQTQLRNRRYIVPQVADQPNIRQLQVLEQLRDESFFAEQ